MKLRLALQTDLESIHQINNSVQAFPWSQLALNDEFYNPLAQAFVTTEGVNITGYAFVRKVDVGLELMTLGVNASHQRHGVATTLLRYISGLTGSLILEVSEKNVAAVTLYKRLGFEIFSIRKRYYPDDSSALCMKLNIANP